MPVKNSTDSDRPRVDVANITAHDLQDDRQLALLYREFVRLKWYGFSNRHFMEFASYAEKALGEDRYGTPGRLFAALVKADEHRITQAQEDRALARFPSGRIYDIIEWIKETNPHSEAKKELKEKTGDTSSILVDRNIGFLPISNRTVLLPSETITE